MRIRRISARFNREQEPGSDFVGLPVARPRLPRLGPVQQFCNVADGPRAWGCIDSLLDREADGRLARDEARPEDRGKAIFVEHGRSRSAAIERWQNRVNPIWRVVAGGCNLNRPIDELVREAGFQIDELETEYLPGPRIMSFTYRGTAT